MRVHAAVDSIVGNVHAFDEPAQPYRNEKQDLWLAVIMNAIRDAFLASDTWLSNTERGRDPELIRGDAHRFLTMRWGPWAESRERICEVAGVDAESLAAACRVRLRAWKAERRTAQVIRIDEALARLVGSESTLSPELITAALVELAEMEAAA